MSKIFVGGSRHASRLNAEIRQRLDNIMGKEFSIVVGDANGADKAIQEYLHQKGYPNVEVYCSNGICRNNVGNWRIRTVRSRARRGTVQFFSAKDRIMAEEAAAGLMLWDGSSIGTLLNAFRLLGLQKKVVLYVVPERRFREFRQSTEWEAFVAQLEPPVREKLNQRVRYESNPAAQTELSLR